MVQMSGSSVQPQNRGMEGSVRSHLVEQRYGGVSPRSFGFETHSIQQLLKNKECHNFSTITVMYVKVYLFRMEMS